VTAYYKTVFENMHFIVVDKAAMVLSVPARLGDKDPRPCLGHILEHDLKCQIYPVHRLDYEVQGLIMFAKTKEAHRAGNSWFENKVIKKTYVAKTSIQNAPTEKINIPFEWTCILLRGKKRSYESPQGKSSITQGVLKEQCADGTYRWHLNPITGRSHQLRYELYRHGCPIIGDELYGSQEKFSSDGIALRAFEINFEKISERSKFDLPEKISILEF
jgi:tRNA pseudouridine32 synthase/23S rRNA pseudouridine746 synthase